MATKNLVPRANKEGQLGTDAKQWNKVIAHTGSFQAVSSSLIPDATNTYDLGSETKFWRDIYVSSGSIKFIDPSDNSVASTLSVGVDGLTLSGNQSVSGSTLPDADNLYDLGSSAKQWKDLYINGTANIDTLTLTSGASVTTINDENDMSSDSDTALATQQSIKAYVDSQVTAQDLDIQGDSGGALSIDLDSETLDIAGGTGISTSGNTNTITITTTDSEIVHDNLSGFVANEHVDHSGVSITAGNGLTGGGTIASTRTIAVGAGTHITVNSNDVEVNTGTLIASISGSIVTTANVTSAGALMDSEVDADIKTLSLPASTTISTFGKTLVDDADASTARTTLGVDAAGTDNSTDVTLTRTPNYITIDGQTITRNTIDIGDDTNLSGGTGITLTGDTLSTTDSEIVHDNLSGFVANEHVDHSGVTMTAGNGLTGGGTIAASRTFAVGAGTGITVAADAVSTNDSEIVHDNLSGFVANEHVDHTSVTLTAGSGLTGGGTIASNRTFNVGAGTHITVNSNDVAVNTGTLIASISGSIVTTANVTSAGALMDSEVDADIKTLSLPASTTISTFGKSLVDDADAGTARATLGVDAAGTDNSTDVTLSGTPNYITISGQTITRNTIDIGDDTNLVAGTNITLSGDTLNVDDAFLKNNADDTTSGTLTAANFVTSGKIGSSTNDEFFD